MISRRLLPTLASGVCAISLFSTVPAAAQEDDLGSLVDKALLAMKAEKWEDGLIANTQAVDRFGKNKPLQLFGPRFGVIYYRKGICELKLKRWGEAMDSFETCHRDFPNPKDVLAQNGNIFHKMALLKWGEAALGAKDWELAINMFQKFLKERDKEKDEYAEGTFHIGMAICYYNLGRIPEGNENLEIAIKFKSHKKFPTPNAGIMAGFQALVSAVILKHNEKALLDFIDKNRGDLVIEPFAMQEYSKVFMKLAGDAIGAEMDRAAMALYQFVPATDVAIDDLRARIKSLGMLKRLKDGSNLLQKKRLEADLAALEGDRRGNKATEIIRLAAAAFLHEKHNNVRGAFAAYQQLEQYYPTTPKRENNLFHLVRTSSMVAPGLITQQYGELFLKTFPNSKHIPAVRRMLLSALFYDGEYETCIEVAEPMLKNLKEGTTEHEICLHVLGGSYFYTNQFGKAQPLLDQHVEKYPKSAFVIAASYFQASNLSRLQFWSKASERLDNFLKTYPDESKNAYLPYALFDRATCHYAMDEPEPALEKLARVINEFSDCNLIDQAYNLKGNVEQSIKARDKAEEAYLKALEIAVIRKNDVVAGESLYSMVALLGEKSTGKEENPRMKDAIPFAERYWKEYAESAPSFKARVAVAQFPAFKAANRSDEALAQLQKIISESARTPEVGGMEELVNSYTDAYLEIHKPAELKEHYYNFPDIRHTDRAARALLRVALIGVYEGIAKKSKEEEVKRAAQATVKTLFQELKTDFAAKDLTNFILVKIGDNLRFNTSNPREALPYYDEAIGREDQSYRFTALIGRGDVYGKSTTTEDLDKGIADLSRVFEDSKEKPQRDFALYRIVEMCMAKKDYAKADENARAYLKPDKTGFTKYTPQVGILLAQSFEARQMNNDAIAMYTKVWSAHMGNIKISAAAMKRWMELLWDRNAPAASPELPGDRQGAYEGGARYIELTSRFKDKILAGDPQERELWQNVEKLVKSYESNPAIKSMDRIRAEKKAGK